LRGGKFKMDEIRSDELYHYGRKGMKWYQNIFTAHKQRKTANKRKKALEKAREAKKQKAIENETLEAKKERILKSKSPKELYENADLFSYKELNDAYSRLTLERNIKNLIPEEVSKGEKFVDGTVKWGKKAADLINTGTDVYRKIDTVRKLFGDGTEVKKPTTTDYRKKKASEMDDDELAKALKRATSENTLDSMIDAIDKRKKEKNN